MAESTTLSTIIEKMKELGIPPVADKAHVFILQDRGVKLRVDCYIGDGLEKFYLDWSNNSDKHYYYDNTMSYSVVVTDGDKAIYSVAEASLNSFPLDGLLLAAEDAIGKYTNRVRRYY